MRNKKFFYCSSFVLIYTLLVIVWGAFVRATGSGAGCGSHWPLCNGVVIPQEPAIATLIELSHRVSSGLMLILVGWLVFLGFRSFPRKSPIRLGVIFAGILTVIEAAIGAVLVLLELVGNNDSVLRAAVTAFHLVNTFLLIAAIAFTVWCANQSKIQRVKFNLTSSSFSIIAAGFLFLLVGASGAVVALGDTLFPSKTFAEGFLQDFSPSAHFLIRLRVVHPFLAILSSMYLFYLASQYRSLMTLGVAVILQVVIGAVTMFLAAPITLQLFHLFFADVTWIAYLFMAFSHVFVVLSDEGFANAVPTGVAQQAQV